MRGKEYSTHHGTPLIGTGFCIYGGLEGWGFSRVNVERFGIPTEVVIPWL